ncbi:Sperm-specific class P protein 31 [Toxocara canis]|uniref:Major sperm protein n=1 Tax=Toxocara canis TaxID=6265 RepID=A0A0B2VL22_TOXCA|nr:Sperm-specific class P protein 31 [Toxocara canis]
MVIVFGVLGNRDWNAVLSLCFAYRQIVSMVWGARDNLGVQKNLAENIISLSARHRMSAQLAEDGGPAFFGSKVPALVVDPPAAILPCGGGICTLMLINMSATRVAFRMHSSNNNNYRLRPVYGFVEATSMAPLEITRLSGPVGADRLAAQFKGAPVDAQDPQSLFKSGQPYGEVIIHLTAQ